MKLKPISVIIIFLFVSEFALKGQSLYMPRNVKAAFEKGKPVC